MAFSITIDLIEFKILGKLQIGTWVGLGYFIIRSVAGDGFGLFFCPSFTKYLNARCLAACKMKTIKSILNLIFFHFPIHEKLYILRCDKKNYYKNHRMCVLRCAKETQSQAKN